MKDLENAGRNWVLILGGSSGLGLATAKKFAQHGYHLIVIHRDRKVGLPVLLKELDELRALGVKVANFNTDATNTEKRRHLITKIGGLLGAQEKVKVLVHSIAKGNLKPMQSKAMPVLDHSDFQLTINAMAISLYDWTKDLIAAQLLASDTRILAFTSEGSTKAWRHYAAVSAAKASLEAIVRNIALEFAPNGIRANCIQAGITDTPSFQKIPGSKVLRNNALKRNPSKRLTLPVDVANVAYLLSLNEAKWITGTIIKADGGESLQ